MYLSFVAYFHGLDMIRDLSLHGPQSKPCFLSYSVLFRIIQVGKSRIASRFHVQIILLLCSICLLLSVYLSFLSYFQGLG